MTITSDRAMTLTIEQIAYDHYLPAKRMRRQPDTIYGYESSIKRNVMPKWGGLTIGGITHDAVQDWVDELAPERGPSGAEKAYKCLRQIIRWAIDKWGLYVADPTRGIEMPRKPEYRPPVLTQRRLKRLIRGMVGCPHEATVIIQCSQGRVPEIVTSLHGLYARMMISLLFGVLARPNMRSRNCNSRRKLGCQS